MKKILTTLAVFGTTLGAFAQGYVNWGVSPAESIISQTNTGYYPGQPGAVQGNTAGLAGNIYYYELLYSDVDTVTPAGPSWLTDLADNWTATGLLMEDSLTGNNGHLVPLVYNTAAEIDPNYTGGPLSLMMVGWSQNLGTTFGGAGGVLSVLQNWEEDFPNAYFGMGFVGQPAALSTTSSAGTQIWTSTQTPGGLISNPSSSPMVLYALPSPEPATLALAVLGGASLLLFRRRK